MVVVHIKEPATYDEMKRVAARQFTLRERLNRIFFYSNGELDEVSKNTPKGIPVLLRKEYDSILFELNNLHDDPETETDQTYISNTYIKVGVICTIMTFKYPA
jgi:hypothetical protein